MKDVNLRLNIRLAAMVVIGGVLLGVGVFGVHYFQVRRLSQFFLAQARAARDSIKDLEDPEAQLEQVRRAAQLYGNYLQLEPDDLDALAECGVMFAELGTSLAERGLFEESRGLFVRALGRLETVLRKSPDRPELRLRLTRLLFRLRQFSDAIDHSKFLCKIPPDIDALVKWFDKYDLWQRVPGHQDPTKARDAEALAVLLKYDKRSVDPTKLFNFLGNDLWMLIEDAELLDLYGRCLSSMDKNESAEKSYEKAIMLAPKQLDTYWRLAMLLRNRLDRPQDADYWMTEVVDANSDSGRAYQMRGRYRRQLVRNLDGDRALRMAEEALQDATTSVSKTVEQIVEKADDKFPKKKATKELKIAFDRVIHTAPPPGGEVTREHRRALLQAVQLTKTFEKVLKPTVQQRDACRDGLLLAAQCSLTQAGLAEEETTGQLAAAEEFAETAAELFPKHPTTYLILADIQKRSGNLDKAISWLRKGETAAGEHTLVLWRLASFLVERGKIDEAQKTIDKLAAAGTSATFTDHLQAQIALARGKWLKASKGFEKVRPELELSKWPGWVRQLDYWLAECYGRMNRLDEQRDAYLRAAASDRTWIPALLGIARTKVKAGQIDSAIEDYRLLVRLGKVPPIAHVELARLLVQHNLDLLESQRDWEEVEEALKEAEKAVPGSVTVVILRAEVLVAREKLKQAAELLVAARENLNKAAKKLLEQREKKLADAKELSGDAREKAVQEAKKLEMAAREKRAAQPAILSALVRLAQRRQNWDGAEEILRRAEGELGDMVTVRLSRASLLLARRGTEAAGDLRKLADDADGFSQYQRLRLWRGLATLSFRAGDSEQTGRLCRRVLEAEPGSQDMNDLLFSVAVGNNDLAAMQEILRQIRQTGGRPGALWYYGEALRLSMLAEKGEKELLDQAQQQLAKAAELRPNWPRVKLLAARIQEQQGNEDAAITSYLEAVDLGARDPSTIRRAARLLSRQRRFREAHEMFQLLEEQRIPFSGEMGREMRGVTVMAGDYKKGLELARKVAANSKEPGDHIVLGQILSVVGRRAKSEKRAAEAEKMLAEAEQVLRRAADMAPEKSETWVALIQFLGRTEQLEKAKRAIKEAGRKISPDQAPLALARCYEVLGEHQQAARQLEAAIKTAPKDPDVARSAATFFFRNAQRQQGEAQLQRIIDGPVQADDRQKAWARRVLASVLFARGGDENRKKAIQLIEENLALDSSSVEDQYAKAWMRAVELGGSRRHESIPVLERLLAKEKSPPPEALFTLAKLYLLEGQWVKFKAQMRKLCTAHKKVPRYVGAFAEELVQRGEELREAEVWTEQLEEIAPDEFATVNLRAKLAFGQRNFETAIKTLKDYIDGPDPEKRGRKECLRLAALSLEEFARRLRDTRQTAMAEMFSKEAQTVYQQHVDLRPGEELLMVEFLSRQHRLDDALSLLEEKWQDCPPEAIALACFAILKNAVERLELMQQVDKTLQAALKKHHNPSVLLVAKAVLRDYQGRYDETEAIYRDILSRNPNDPTVMNNLAVFLSLQKKNLDEALQLVNRTIQIVGSTPGLLDTRAMVYLARKEPEKALRDLHRAIADTANAVRYFHLAQAYQRTGQKKPAVDALAEAHELGLKEEDLQKIEQRAYLKLKVILK